MRLLLATAAILTGTLFAAAPGIAAQKANEQRAATPTAKPDATGTPLPICLFSVKGKTVAKAESAKQGVAGQTPQKAQRVCESNPPPQG